jgi:electron transfer flavoprotein beta subunit
MDIVVFLKMVPDVIEELTIGDTGKSLDTQFLRMKLNDPDDFSLEEALILKEKYGGTVTVVAMEAPEVDEVLFTALAKGADKVVKIPGDWTGIQAPGIARLIAAYFTVANHQPGSETIILVGSQAIDDLEGEIAPYLSEILSIPYIGVITGINFDAGNKKVEVIKEFASGLRGKFELSLPAIIGIQSAEKPPRYVPVAKVRAVMKTAKIETVSIGPPDVASSVSIEKMFIPEAGGKAKMIEGSPEEVSSQMVEILKENGILRR